MKAVGVIPARWASTRLPGKSLVALARKPLIQWVVEAVRRAVAGQALVSASVGPSGPLLEPYGDTSPDACRSCPKRIRFHARTTNNTAPINRVAMRTTVWTRAGAHARKVST